MDILKIKFNDKCSKWNKSVFCLHCLGNFFMSIWCELKRRLTLQTFRRSLITIGNQYMQLYFVPPKKKYIKNNWLLKCIILCTEQIIITVKNLMKPHDKNHIYQNSTKINSHRADGLLFIGWKDAHEMERVNY